MEKIEITQSEYEEYLKLKNQEKVLREENSSYSNNEEVYGFLTLPKPVAELWGHKEEDIWDELF